MSHYDLYVDMKTEIKDKCYKRIIQQRVINYNFWKSATSPKPC